LPLFKFEEDQCDVVDRDKLKRYRELAARWFDWLDTDDEHAIGRQLSDLMWHDAVFRILNEARRVDGADASASRAPLLARFIDQGYVSGQVLGISKLVEPSPDVPNTKKGVISLKRVVDELSTNRDLFTREVFVAHDGLPYDPAPVRQAYLADLVARHGTEPVVEAMETEGPLAWDTSERLHELFDRLTGIKADARQREDRLPDAVFDTLVKALDDPVFAEIRALRHKRLAHAADAVSRLHGPPKVGLKLDDAAQAHRILLGVLQAISAGVLYGAWRGAAIPVAQFNIFEHFPDPLVREDQVERLRKAWDEIAAERDGWLAEGYAKLLGLPA
jgi:hypothetical protein